MVSRRWDATIERAQGLPPDVLHAHVPDEWSFIQTLRHLNFAVAAWIGRMLLGDPSPWHPLDLPWHEAPGWEGIPWDRDATPTRDEVLGVWHQRRALVDGVMENLPTSNWPIPCRCPNLAGRATRTSPCRNACGSCSSRCGSTATTPSATSTPLRLIGLEPSIGPNTSPAHPSCCVLEVLVRGTRVARCTTA
jgi:hypothetical protein